MQRSRIEIDGLIAGAIREAGDDGLSPTGIFVKTGCHHSTIMSFIRRHGGNVVVVKIGRRKRYAWNLRAAEPLVS